VSSPADWSPFTIRIRSTLEHPRARGAWAGWWRHEGNFVLTLAERSE
jgi:hypothetical protein